MDNRFVINLDDNGYVIKFKSEANILLASLNENEVADKYNELVDAIPIINHIGNVLYDTTQDNVNNIISVINKFWNVGLLSPLTLQDNEFCEGDGENIRTNKRYYHIRKLQNDIYNTRAYNVFVRAFYSHKTNEQINLNPFLVECSPRIYISKGGVITGEYIQECFIRDNIIKNKCFTIQSIITIPVCVIKNDDTTLYVVDHREPKLNILRQFYDVPIKIDEEVKNTKYNIRKYKKI